MTAEVKDNVSPEVVPQVTEASQQVDPTPAPSPQKENFARLRKKAEQLEAELNREREINARIMAMQPAPKSEPDELDTIGGEEYINKSKIDKLVEKRARTIAEETVKRETARMLEEQKNAQFLDRLKAKYSDFDSVVTPETLALLEEKNPELAGTIAEIRDPYKVGVQSYNYIKALNIAADVPDARRAREVEKKLEDNSKTIVSPQVYEKRPMAEAFSMAQMSEVEKSKIYREMMQYASQAGY